MKSMLLLFPFAIWAALFLTSHSFPSLFEEYNALRSFKQAIYEDPFHMLSDWNENGGNPCEWSGVTCSGDKNHVLSLDLSNSSLKGFITPELGGLAHLQKLLLCNNLFLGIIPKEIGMLKSLNVLDLSTNMLTGSIPPEIGNLTSIFKINFHSNGLTGALPPELGNLKSLVQLRLDRNRLEGSIPGSGSSSSNMSSSHKFTGLCLLDKLDIGNLSYNFFTGKIPNCLEYLPRSSFKGNCMNINYPKQRTSKQCDGYTHELSSGSSSPMMQSRNHLKHQQPRQPEWLLILEIITGVLLVIFIVTVTVAAMKRYKPKSSFKLPWKKASTSKNRTIKSVDCEMLKHVLRLTRHELEVACEDFSNIIGSSSDSVVYKGTLKDGPEIAVISLCISIDHWTSHLELYFQSEVANLARLTHENTAKLLGYCKENDPFSRMLVFEYASNGTLYEHLHYGEGCNLSWSRRMKIVTGIARGLRYMHTGIQPPFSLSELHSSAVYLTEDFSPKLVDFESWKTVLTRAENSGFIVNGKPFQDSIQRSNIDVQGNTYSFGVILLEIVSGRPPSCKDRGHLVDWATQYLEKPDQMCHLVDPKLRYFNHDDLRAVCSVVGLCIHSEPSKRPSMHVLASILENGIDTSAAASLKESPLAWAEQALSS